MEAISFNDFMALADRSKFAMESYLKDDLLPPVFFRGGDRWFLKADVDAWLDSNGLCKTAAQWQAAKLHFEAAQC